MGRFFYWGLDAMVVGAPAGDVLLDGFGFKALGEGFVDEGGKFSVGGKAEGNDLLDIELLDVGVVVGWKEGGEAKALFEADDAVLDLEIVHAGSESEDDEGGREEDPPEMKVAMMRPVMDGDRDGDEEVDEKDREDKEVHGWIEATVILVALGCRHS
jgi:hypothetical protein